MQQQLIELHTKQILGNGEDVNATCGVLGAVFTWRAQWWLVL